MKKQSFTITFHIDIEHDEPSWAYRTTTHASLIGKDLCCDQVLATEEMFSEEVLVQSRVRYLQYMIPHTVLNCLRPMLEKVGIQLEKMTDRLLQK